MTDSIATPPPQLPNQVTWAVLMVHRYLYVYAEKLLGHESAFLFNGAYDKMYLSEVQEFYVNTQHVLYLHTPIKIQNRDSERVIASLVTEREELRRKIDDQEKTMLYMVKQISKAFEKLGLSAEDIAALQKSL